MSGSRLSYYIGTSTGAFLSRLPPLVQAPGEDHCREQQGRRHHQDHEQGAKAMGSCVRRINNRLAHCVDICQDGYVTCVRYTGQA